MEKMKKFDKFLRRKYKNNNSYPTNYFDRVKDIEILPNDETSNSFGKLNEINDKKSDDDDYIKNLKFNKTERDKNRTNLNKLDDEIMIKQKEHSQEINIKKSLNYNDYENDNINKIGENDGKISDRLNTSKNEEIHEKNDNNNIKDMKNNEKKGGGEEKNDEKNGEQKDDKEKNMEKNEEEEKIDEDDSNPYPRFSTNNKSNNEENNNIENKEQKNNDNNKESIKNNIEENNENKNDEKNNNNIMNESLKFSTLSDKEEILSNKEKNNNVFDPYPKFSINKNDEDNHKDEENNNNLSDIVSENNEIKEDIAKEKEDKPKEKENKSEENEEKPEENEEKLEEKEDKVEEKEDKIEEKNENQDNKEDLKDKKEQNKGEDEGNILTNNKKNSIINNKELKKNNDHNNNIQQTENKRMKDDISVNQNPNINNTNSIFINNQNFLLEECEYEESPNKRALVCSFFKNPEIIGILIVLMLTIGSMISNVNNIKFIVFAIKSDLLTYDSSLDKYPLIYFSFNSITRILTGQWVKYIIGTEETFSILYTITCVGLISQILGIFMTRFLIYISIALAGITHGSIMTFVPLYCRYYYHPKDLGTVLGFLQTGNAIGSIIIATLIFPHYYHKYSNYSDSIGEYCKGKQCFRKSYVINTFFMVIAVFLAYNGYRIHKQKKIQ